MNNELLGVLEGLLFVQGDEGLKLDDIANILEISKDEVKELLTLLQKEYQNSNLLQNNPNWYPENENH